MESDEARKAMIARVQATAEKYPFFLDLPEVEMGEIYSPIAGRNDQGMYVRALYMICAVGNVTGRCGDNLCGEPIEGLKEPPPETVMRIAKAKAKAK
jgi:hypothetical protein